MTIQNNVDEIVRNEFWKNMTTNHVIKLASLFDRLLDKDEDGLNSLLAEFHNAAGKLPLIEDKDFGAVVLEETARNLQDPKLKIRLIKEAKYRAHWCLTSATAASEAHARSSHYDSLQKYLDELLKE